MILELIRVLERKVGLGGRGGVYIVSWISINVEVRIPCKKCDMGSHGNSESCHIVTNRRSKFGPNPHQIPSPYHVIYPVLLVFHAGTWHGFWTSSGHGISMAFAKKMMGFPVRFWSHSRTKPNCRQKDMRKSVSHFLQGPHLYAHSQPSTWFMNQTTIDNKNQCKELQKKKSQLHFQEFIIHHNN